MIKRWGYFLASLLGLATLVLPAAQVLAASATLYLAPASGSVINGNTITVSVRENSGGDQVNAVQANLSYPANLFDVKSINSSSAFSIVAQNSYGNGSIQIARGANPPVSGDQLVASIVFKAKASSGTAAVSFASGSAVTANDGNGTNILSGTSGGNYALKPVPPASPAAPAAPKDTTPPTISAVKVESTTPNTAVIAWTTSEPATSEVDYGINSGYGLVAVDGNLVTDHKITLNSPIISPATNYHFVVKSTDPAGNQAAGTDQTFQTQGGVLNVTVLNQKKKPVNGALVSFAGQNAKTDKNGKASLSYLPAGNLTGYVEYKGAKTVETVNIKTADPSKPQSASFQIKTSSSWLIYLIPIIIILGILIYILSRVRRTPTTPPHKPEMMSMPPPSFPSSSVQTISPTPPMPVQTEPAQEQPAAPPQTPLQNLPPQIPTESS